MTTEEAGTASPSDEYVLTDQEIAAEAGRLSRTDHFLQWLVDVANATPDWAGMSVTLSVHGQLITGTLVSALQYFKAVEPMLSPDDDTAAAGTANGLLAAFTQVYRNPPETRRPPAYLHLEDAHYVSATGQVPHHSGEGVRWRGKIESVDGFSFGELQVQTVDGNP